MNSRFFLLAAVFLFIACSRLEPLTPEVLAQFEAKWKSSRPDSYRLAIEMSGDRVEKGRFDVLVRSGHVATLRRNDQVITPGPGQDYSMEGLFQVLRQELGLAEKPATLGAPAGYSVYTTAEFDQATGRLIHYRRSVGGTANSIDIKVLEYDERLRMPAR